MMFIFAGSFISNSFRPGVLDLVFGLFVLEDKFFILFVATVCFVGYKIANIIMLFINLAKFGFCR